MNSKLEFATNVLEKQLGWISAVDGKVPAIYAINIAMLGALSALIPQNMFWSLCSIVFCSLSIFLLLGSMGFLIITIFPRLSGPKKSLIYFGDIVSRTNASYINEMTKVSDAQIFNDLLVQTYRNAEIAKTKYAALKNALILTFLSFMPWLISICLICFQISKK